MNGFRYNGLNSNSRKANVGDPDSRLVRSEEHNMTLSGYGASANKRIVVTIGNDGLVDSVDVDPQVLRWGTDELTRLIQEAMCEAQRDWFRQFTERIRSEMAFAEKSRLQKKLDEIDEDYIRQMEDLSRIIADSLTL